VARKRMFRLDVIDTDAFIDMPLSAQALYFHLCMRADDDGFIGNPKRIARLISASDDDLKILIAKRFIITFEDGIIVIKHWRMHNTIQKDRYVHTVFEDEYKMLTVKDNKAYSLGNSSQKTTPQIEENADEIHDDSEMFPKCFQNVSADIDIDIGIGKGLGIDKGIDKGLDVDKDIKNNSEKDKSFSLSFSGRENQSIYDEIIQHWNTLPDTVTKVNRISQKGTRKSLLDARLKEYGIENIHKAIENIANSEFLLGKNNKGWTVKFDWFILPNNFIKVLEGNYLGKAHVTSSYTDAIHSRMDVVNDFLNGGT
jgi:hypothetical protein